ncbi:hypothetical protein BDP81DRAFT_435213 [Colletotrichum phormii]|uniref:Uncharacterized protein n=1 Tax=Colletotrichum phormii TaxID=359342 RepID=A0AAI9ZJD2_9PEZI|nr:uncharacterized protein BDP81DRAFT_435213 [Colletotrichum phormii]KAK1625684.1 hypothetical protein BDP81DRAFT_435213 [Colletotrichum phormii]
MTTETREGEGREATHLHRRSWNCGCKICPGCPRSYTSQRASASASEAKQSKAKHNIQFSKKTGLVFSRNAISFPEITCDAPRRESSAFAHTYMPHIHAAAAPAYDGEGPSSVGSWRCTHSPTLEEKEKDTYGVERWEKGIVASVIEVRRGRISNESRRRFSTFIANGTL